MAFCSVPRLPLRKTVSNIGFVEAKPARTLYPKNKTIDWFKVINAMPPHCDIYNCWIVARRCARGCVQNNLESLESFVMVCYLLAHIAQHSWFFRNIDDDITSMEYLLTDPVFQRERVPINTRDFSTLTDTNVLAVEGKPPFPWVYNESYPNQPTH